MQKSQVVVLKCNSYDTNEVESIIAKGIDLLGGVNEFVNKDETILLKPNMLMSAKPEKAITTNPSVLHAVGKIFKTTSAKIKYGDSPAVGNPKKVAKKCGFKDVMEKLNIEFADFENGKNMDFKDAKINQRFFIANGVSEADGIINIAKLKPHGLARMTCCLKNTFGYVQGFKKAEFHFKYPNYIEFLTMMIDLHKFFKPRLNIIDAIISMEGNGPSSGTPKKTNCIIMSKDPVAADVAACLLVGIDLECVPSIKIANDAGLGNSKLENIEFLGDNIDELKSKNFKIEREKFKDNPTKTGLVSFLQKRLLKKPVSTPDLCKSCRKCVDVCPVPGKAIKMVYNKKHKKETPQFDLSKCIRCFCCQEMCEFDAIKIKKPLLSRFI